MVDAPAIDHSTGSWDFGNYLFDIAAPRFAKKRQPTLTDARMTGKLDFAKKKIQKKKRRARHRNFRLFRGRRIFELRETNGEFNRPHAMAGNRYMLANGEGKRARSFCITSFLYIQCSKRKRAASFRSFRETQHTLVIWNPIFSSPVNYDSHFSHALRRRH